MNDLHYIKYDPKIMMLDTMGLTPLAKLAHRQLFDMTLIDDGPPRNDDYVLAEKAGCKPKDWPKVKAELMTKGYRVSGDYFVHNGTVNTLNNSKRDYVTTYNRTAKAGGRALLTLSVTDAVTGCVTIGVTDAVTGDGSEPSRMPLQGYNQNQNQNQSKERESSAPPDFAEIPSWEEFWSYCQSAQCGLPAEFYARDKFLAASQDNWKNKSNWRQYANRCRTWWESDGRPMNQNEKHSRNSAKPNPRNIGTAPSGTDFKAAAARRAPKASE